MKSPLREGAKVSDELEWASGKKDDGPLDHEALDDAAGDDQESARVRSRGGSGSSERERERTGGTTSPRSRTQPRPSRAAGSSRRSAVHDRASQRCCEGERRAGKPRAGTDLGDRLAVEAHDDAAHGLVAVLDVEVDLRAWRQGGPGVRGRARGSVGRGGGGRNQSQRSRSLGSRSPALQAR